MNPLINYQAAAKLRASQFLIRVALGFVIVAVTVAVSPAPLSYWPVIWLGAMIATQVPEVLLDRFILSLSGGMPRGIAVLTVGLTGLNSFVYGTITVYLWSCGMVAREIAIILLCSFILHTSMHLYQQKKILIASMGAQCVFMVGLPISSALGDGQAGIIPLAAIFAAWGGYLGHLIAVVSRADQTNQSLKNAKAQAEAQQRLAEAASASKSEFLARVSHEIRTPLNAVTSAAQLLGQAKLPAQYQDYVSILTNGSDVLLGLINDVLDMSKIEAGKISVNLGDVDLEKTVEALATLWRPMAVEKGLTLQVRQDPALPALIRSDRLRLTQIVSNLLSNAIKFTSEGGIQIVVSQDGVSQDGGRDSPSLRIEVIDTGPGMSADVVGRLFRTFEQADATIAGRFGGTGLGLAISRKLAELLGGTLTVHSTPGRGTAFALQIPLVPVTVAPVTVAPMTVVTVKSGTAPDDAMAAGAVSRGEQARPLAILAAEDHPINRKLLGLFLEPLGWDVTMVADGVEAVAAAGKQPFDLILMDMQMPRMSGLEAASLIMGGNGPNRTTPIVALTANAFDEQRVQWEEVGAAGFLAKPIDSALMIDTILRLTAGPRETAESLDERLPVAV